MFYFTYECISNVNYHRLFYSEDGQVRIYESFPRILLRILAWTAAAVDNQRVVAAVPAVMDLVNLRPVR